MPTLPTIDNCTACGACIDSCNHGAISMLEDKMVTIILLLIKTNV